MFLGVSNQPVDLLADGIDCVLRIGELPSSTMVGRLLGQLTMATCASPGYLETNGTPVLFDDLSSHHAVNYFSGRGHRPVSWHLPDGEGERELRMNTGVAVNDTEALIGSALAGLGLIQLPGICLSEHLRAGTLVEILTEARSIRRPMSIMYPARRHLAPQVRAFVDWAAKTVEAARGDWIGSP